MSKTSSKKQAHETTSGGRTRAAARALGPFASKLAADMVMEALRHHGF